MHFRISALEADKFGHLFGQDDEALSSQGVHRLVVDHEPGFPCRVSLRDAGIGDRVLLLNYEHQPAATPFRSSHAIYVCEGASQARPGKNDVPRMFRHRLLSLRAFDGAGMMVDADVIGGVGLESLIKQMLAEEAAAYLHIHNAKLGCYLARVDRA